MCIRDSGIAAYKASQGVKDYDVNRDATRNEMRSFVCGQCHVEYYFKGEGKTLTFPWSNGLKVDNICLLYTSDAADERSSVDLGGRRIIKKKTSNRLRIDNRNKKMRKLEQQQHTQHTTREHTNT